MLIAVRYVAFFCASFLLCAPQLCGRKDTITLRNDTVHDTVTGRAFLVKEGFLTATWQENVKEQTLKPGESFDFEHDTNNKYSYFIEVVDEAEVIKSAPYRMGKAFFPCCISIEKKCKQDKKTKAYKDCTYVLKSVSKEQFKK